MLSSMFCDFCPYLRFALKLSFWSNPTPETGSYFLNQGGKLEEVENKLEEAENKLEEARKDFKRLSMGKKLLREKLEAALKFNKALQEQNDVLNGRSNGQSL